MARMDELCRGRGAREAVRLIDAEAEQKRYPAVTIGHAEEGLGLVCDGLVGC